MIFQCALGYEALSTLEKLTQESRMALAKRFPSLSIPEKEGDYWYNYDREIVADEEDFDFLIQLGFSPKVSRLRGVRYPEGIGSNVAVNPAINFFQAATTGVSLFHVTRVQVLEDACTDALQQELDGGWRILAVCPPNDTRRPTYILGRVQG